MDLKATIRTVPNFPKDGIMFRDVTTLLANPTAPLDYAIEQGERVVVTDDLVATGVRY